MIRYPLLASALLLAACSGGEVGSNVDEGSFGTPTMVNTLAMQGEYEAAALLGTRFTTEVPDTVTFAFNSDVLTPQAQAILTRQAQWIRKFPEVKFSVFGHTDLVGTEAYNKGLGQRRAMAAVNFLVSQGVSRGRLQGLVSYGETRPVVATPSPEQRNRRAVTSVAGFTRGHVGLLNGKYAAIVMREYVNSAVPISTASETETMGSAGGN